MNSPSLPAPKVRLSTFVAVIAVAGPTLALELLQTRVLSALYYNHVVYLTVTVALLGFGISGILVSIFSQRLRDPAKLAAWGMAAFAVSAPFALHAISYSPVIFYPTTGVVYKLLFCYGVLIVPYVVSGATLGILLMLHGQAVHRLYFVDLVASAVGVLCFVFLLRPLGAEGMAWAISGFAFGGFVIYAIGNTWRWSSVFAATIPLLLMVALWRGQLIGSDPDFYKIGGFLDSGLHSAPVETTQWTPIAKIDVISQRMGHERMITQDRDAITVLPNAKMIDRVRKQAQDHESIYVACLGYLLRPKPADSLVIGVGGGIDVVCAKLFGAQQVTGVEINPATIDLIQGPYADYVQWPHWEGIEEVNRDGRNYLAAKSNAYDTIVIAAIDTFSALSSGAYVLSENYLYTTDAMRDYLEALKPDGVLTIFRWLFQTPRETLRLVNLYVQAAEELGIQEPSKCIMVVGTDFGWPYRWAAVVMKKQPFTPEEVRTILDQVERQQDNKPDGLSGPLATVYIPDVFPAEEQRALEEKFGQVDDEYYAFARRSFRRLIRGNTEQRAEFADHYVHNITPVSDDRPFFFEYHKLGELFSVKSTTSDLRGAIVHYTLFILLAVTLAVAVVGILLPLWFSSREGLKVVGVAPLMTFFSSLGVGFMFIELGTMQFLNMYLGDPMISLAVVLSGMLCFTGCGSLLAGRAYREPRSLLRFGMLGTAVAAIVWLLVMGSVKQATIGSPDGVRIALVLASILPLAGLMGVPFATGLRMVDATDRRFIPWAWGVNGITSVMSSILAIIVAMRFGFSAVLVLGSLIYVGGYFAVTRYLRITAAPPAESPTAERSLVIEKLPDVEIQNVGSGLL